MRGDFREFYGGDIRLFRLKSLFVLCSIPRKKIFPAPGLPMRTGQKKQGGSQKYCEIQIHATTTKTARKMIIRNTENHREDLMSLKVLPGFCFSGLPVTTIVSRSGIRWMVRMIKALLKRAIFFHGQSIENVLTRKNFTAQKIH
jgi:hypothetical protein